MILYLYWIFLEKKSSYIYPKLRRRFAVRWWSHSKLSKWNLSNCQSRMNNLLKNQPHGHMQWELKNDGPFENAQMTDFNGLFVRAVSSLIPFSEAKLLWIYEPSSVDTLEKNKKLDAIYKLRLVVQAFNDFSHGLLAPSFTVQCLLRRLFWQLRRWAIVSHYSLAMFANLRSIENYSATFKLCLPVGGSKQTPKTLLWVELVLFGIQEDGLYWYRTYQSITNGTFGLLLAMHNLCLVYVKLIMYKIKRQLDRHAFVWLQTNDDDCDGAKYVPGHRSKMAIIFDCKHKTVFSNKQICILIVPLLHHSDLCVQFSNLILWIDWQRLLK